MIFKQLTGLVITAVLINNLHAATFNVTSQNDASDATAGDGICETALNNGICTLRAAIDEANALAGVDTINIPLGNYILSGPAVNANTSGSLFINSEMIITGSNTVSTVIDGNNIDRVFSIQSLLPVKLTNLTIQNGSAGAGTIGGGINLGANSDVSLDALIIKNNQAKTGAGIGANTAIKQLMMSNSRIENNFGSPVAGSKGGGLSTSTGMINILTTSIQNNSAQYGGGIFSLGSLRLENSAITNNSATIPDNNTDSVYAGGGIHLGGISAATLVTINTTISGNQTLSNGAGILIANGSASLYNTTLVNNIADSDKNGAGIGGGVIAGSFSNVKQLFLSNTIIAGNLSSGKAPDCSTFNLNIFSSGYNIIGNNSDCLFTTQSGDQVGNNVTVIDPRLAPLALNGGTTLSHALLFNSPAIDSGNPANCVDDTSTLISTDQRAQARPIDGGTGNAICDIGAFETTPFPLTKAGPDQIVALGSTVTLDGTASSALAGIQSYRWIQIPTATVTLNNPNSVQSTFIAPTTPSTLRFELSVTDNNAALSSDTVVITVNAPPTARAGADQRVNSGSTVNLNGDTSSDTDGTIKSFNWSQTAGSAVTLTNNNAAATSFTAPTTAGELRFTLTVVDDIGSSNTDIIIITVNAAPIAQAGIDQRVNSGDLVNLDGASSRDTDGSIVHYNWSQTVGPEVVLSDNTLATPSFTAPENAGILSFTLSTTDNDGTVSTDFVEITVNAAPIANAGVDQYIPTGDKVILDGNNSIDNDGNIVSYAWQQTTGKKVKLINSDSVNASFTASKKLQKLTFQLTVVDNDGIANEDSITINVGIEKPAEPDNTRGGGGGGCTMNRSAQFDPMMLLLVLFIFGFRVRLKLIKRCHDGLTQAPK